VVLRFWRFVAALFLVAAASASAQQPADMVRAWELSRGEERILSFVSAVTIERDGDLDVTETIRLVSLRQTINHGIQRDFPTTYSTAAGQKTKVGFEVVSVQRNGQGEPWERLSLSNGARIRIGSAEVTLPIGEHTFVIRYRTTRQIHYGETSDELYWNVTGTGWTFPIDLAEAQITLPTEAKFGNRAVYTGPQGATDGNAEVTVERPGYIAFRTTKPLGREEGLTVAAAFPKGVLDEPGQGQRAAWWLEDWGALATAILGSLGVAFYYLRAWWKVGRGPRAGTVVPIFAPPEGLSAAAVRFVTRMGMDNRAFSAAMVDLGVRGKLHITQEEGGWLSKGTTTLSRAELPRPGFDTSLPEPERAMREKLFSSGDSLELKQANHARLQGARTALEKGLAAAFEGTMFVKNREWAVYGLFLILLTVLAAAAVALFFTTIYPWQVKFGLPMGGAILLFAAWSLKGSGTGHKVDAKGCLRMVATGLLVFAGLSATAMTVIAALPINAPAVLLPLITLPLAITAFWWIYAPTPAGRQMMDRIAGFKQYLSITEESRLEAMHPPEKTPELFERYLPYAIALDVENRWAEKFAGVLAAAAASGAAAGTAAWYSGHGNMWDDPGRFASDVGSSLASTVSSAATSPSSSSGSSGGGSSGGGGGGGGGSGW
jgi:hypothetical protein